MIRLSEKSKDPHLRSAKEVIGYTIHAQDGEIGKVDDIFMDEGAFQIHYFLVDTRKWLPGRKVLISPHWIDDIRWTNREVAVRATKAQVKESPEYDPKPVLSHEYESNLHMHYEAMRTAMPY